ncbi:MAG: TolC family protein [Deltaproteobacteria bacterium]|nr:TolC family protein [Deltaproteobacteria bacterium]
MAAIASSGCISSQAGYADVRSQVRGRARADVAWRAADGDADPDRVTREILSRPLDADAAVRLALLNNRELQASFQDLGIARAELVRAVAIPNPSAEMSYRFGTGSGQRNSPEIAATFSVTQLIYMPLRKGAANAQLEAAILSTTGAALDVAYEARLAFYDVQAADQNVELGRTVLAATRASAEAAQRLRDAGNITALELATEQALYEEARLTLARAEVEQRVARETLNRRLGLWGTSVAWKVEGRLPDPPDDALDTSGLAERAVERSVDLALLDRQYTAAARRANLARIMGVLPELRGGVAAEREDGPWVVGPAVRVEVPLFYQGRGEVVREKSEMMRQQELHAAAAVRIRAVARAATTRLAMARDSAIFYKQTLLPLRQKILDETQLQFNAMSVGVFQLLLAKREQVAAGRAYIAALRAYWSTRASVDQLLAGRVPPMNGMEADMAGSEPQGPAR